MTKELQVRVETRWHLKARRVLDPCRCLWVIPYGIEKDAYRSFVCLQHRPATSR